MPPKRNSSGPASKSKGRPKRGPRGARTADGLAALFSPSGDADAAAAAGLGDDDDMEFASLFDGEGDEGAPDGDDARAIAIAVGSSSDLEPVDEPAAACSSFSAEHSDLRKAVFALRPVVYKLLEYEPAAINLASSDLLKCPQIRNHFLTCLIPPHLREILHGPEARAASAAPLVDSSSSDDGPPGLVESTSESVLSDSDSDFDSD
jgi:hypothetical protein